MPYAVKLRGVAAAHDGGAVKRAQENPPAIPPGAANLDHFQCYGATGKAEIAKTYTVRDQFTRKPKEPQELSNFLLKFLCSPTSKKFEEKAGTPIHHQNDHLVCYRPRDPKAVTGDVKIRNQLEAPTAVLHFSGPDYLCFPSTKKRGA